MQITLPSGRVEELYFADPKFNGHMIDILIFVRKDGRLEPTHRGMITKVDGHPCHLSMTGSESFIREQLDEISKKMFDLDTLPPRKPPVARKALRQAQKNGRLTEGQGKFVIQRGPLVLHLTDVQVGDVISGMQTERFFTTYAGWRIASHKRYKNSGNLSLVSDDGRTEKMVYSKSDFSLSIQVIRG